MYLQCHNWITDAPVLLSAEAPAICTVLSLHHRVSADGTSQLVRLFHVCPVMGFSCSTTVTITDISLQMYFVKRPPSQMSLIYLWRSI